MINEATNPPEGVTYGASFTGSGIRPTATKWGRTAARITIRLSGTRSMPRTQERRLPLTASPQPVIWQAPLLSLSSMCCLWMTICPDRYSRLMVWTGWVLPL